MRSYTPKVMSHPAHVAASPNKGHALVGHRGNRDRLPDVTVRTQEQEDAMRAKGYLLKGERAVVPVLTEYPMMMIHPDHEPAVEEKKHMMKDADGVTKTWSEAACPAKFPHKVARDEYDVEEFKAQGYVLPGTADSVAFSKLTNDTNRQAGSEWPKWIDGVLVQDPHKVEDFSREYPKFVKGKIVNSRAEEIAALPPEERVKFEEDAEKVKKIRLEAMRAQLAALEAELQAEPAEEDPADDSAPAPKRGRPRKE